MENDIRLLSQQLFDPHITGLDGPQRYQLYLRLKQNGTLVDEQQTLRALQEGLIRHDSGARTQGLTKLFELAGMVTSQGFNLSQDWHERSEYFSLDPIGSVLLHVQGYVDEAVQQEILRRMQARATLGQEGHTPENRLIVHRPSQSEKPSEFYFGEIYTRSTPALVNGSERTLEANEQRVYRLVKIDGEVAIERVAVTVGDLHYHDVVAIPLGDDTFQKHWTRNSLDVPVDTIQRLFPQQKDTTVTDEEIAILLLHFEENMMGPQSKN